MLDRVSFKKMEEVWESSRHNAPSHYECSLLFNQEIGIMVKVMVEE